MTYDEAIRHSEWIAREKRTLSMELEEAIKHARQKAKEMRILSTANHEGVESCIRCAEEHEKLAMWLEELQARREEEKWINPEERLPKAVDRELNTEDVMVVRQRYFAGKPVPGEKFIDVDYYNHRLGIWMQAPDEIIAWRPLPKLETEEDYESNDM